MTLIGPVAFTMRIADLASLWPESGDNPQSYGRSPRWEEVHHGLSRFERDLELFHHTGNVDVMPKVRDESALSRDNRHRMHRHLLVGGGHAHQLAFVRAGPDNFAGNDIAAGDDAGDFTGSIGKSIAPTLKRCWNFFLFQFATGA